MRNINKYDLKKIVKNILIECNYNSSNKILNERNNTPVYYTKQINPANVSDNTAVRNIIKFPTKKNNGNYIKSLIKKLESSLFIARDKSWESGIAKSLFNNKSSIANLAAACITFMKTLNNWSPSLLKATIGILFRETKGIEEHNLHPKELLQLYLNLFTGNKTDYSQGLAQIRPSVAKEYGIDYYSLYTLDGSLRGIYTMLSKNYSTAKKFYSGPTVTIFKNNKLTQIPAIGGDAALHMTVAAHNAGTGILTNWCETNIPNVANKCNITSRELDLNGQKKIVITKKNKKINNYFPKLSTLHSYTPPVKTVYDALVSVPNQIYTIIKLGQS